MSSRSICLRMLLALLVLMNTAVFARPAVTILHAPEPSSLEVLAARELQRYVYLRTGEVAPIVQRKGELPAEGDVIHVGDVPPLTEIVTVPEGYVLKSHREDGRGIASLAGGDEIGTLYAAYRFAEHLGIRFYLEGDVVPDQRIAWKMPNIDERGKPLFDRRGIQPFHDFPEGPDWWSLDGYKAIISQLPKLRMNFFGLHTYPQGGVGPEPTVWIGPPEHIDEDGAVLHSYPSRHFSTLNGTWGYRAKKTCDYSYGCDMLFEHDAYCQEVQVGKTPWPADEAACNTLFDDFGAKLRSAFEHARHLGVKTCVGTEVPLIVPKKVAERFDLPPSPIETIGGNAVTYGEPIAGTDDDPLYQSVRWNLKGYRLKVPNGTFTVTLKFAEVAHHAVGQRVFDVKIQGRGVIENLDILQRAGKNTALDVVHDGVEVTDGTLRIDFVRKVEFPCISGFMVQGNDVLLKVNCGGGPYQDYVSDEPILLRPADYQKLYEGMFTWIQRSYPIDYYWFWTPEGWTWSNVAESTVKATMDDMKYAIAAAEKLNVPFTLATCGWVLGPQYDRSLFDRQLPKTMPMSCISRAVGHDPVEPGFAQVAGRPKWAIPWLEDDPALTSPQLWAGRMRKDAADALKYGCTGLLGIHWRTRILSMNVSALAMAAWDQSGWSQRMAGDARHAPADDFYADWALSQFGPEVADEAARLFARLDGKLPRPSDWVEGPGGLKPDPRPWDEVVKEYGFVEEMAALSPRVSGAGHRERFDYWLNQFRFMKAVARINCLWAGYNDVMKAVEAEKDAAAKGKLATEKALPIRVEIIKLVEEVHRYLLATVSNTGEMGTIANWQQHIMPRLLDEPGKALVAVLGSELSAAAQPSMTFVGPTRLFVPEVRTSVSVGEPLNLRPIVLDAQPPRAVKAFWRPIGRGDYTVVPATHVDKGIWLVRLPAAEDEATSLEYYVEAELADGRRLHFPPTAPALCQTVVIEPRGNQSEE